MFEVNYKNKFSTTASVPHFMFKRPVDDGWLLYNTKYLEVNLKCPNLIFYPLYSLRPDSQFDERMLVEEDFGRDWEDGRQPEGHS